MRFSFGPRRLGDLVGPPASPPSSPRRLTGHLKPHHAKDPDWLRPDERASRDAVAEIRASAEISGSREAPPTGALRTRVSVVVLLQHRTPALDLLLRRAPEFVDEIVVVHTADDGGHHATADDRRTDTPAVAQDATPDHAGVQYVHAAQTGFGFSVRTGADHSTGEIVVVATGDGTHDLSELPMLIGALLGGADFAEASRFMQGGGGHGMTTRRRLRARLLATTLRVTAGVRISDAEYRYLAFWRHSLPALSTTAAGDGPDATVALKLRARRAGLAVMEVPSYESRAVADSPPRDGFVTTIRCATRERFAAVSPGQSGGS